MDDELKVRLELQEEPTDDKEIFTRAFLSTGFVGVGGMGATAALTALGMEVPGVTYRGDTDLLSQTAGAGGSMLKRASDMLKAIGSGDVEKGATIINNSNFLNAFPFLGNFFKAGGKMLIEENINE
jgi:D-arabinose 1-dehydrogenase-like Zn-dependent alcohol dehydrogenase